MMKIEIVEINTSPSLQSWSNDQASPFVAFYDGSTSLSVIFVPGVIDMEIPCVWNLEELVRISIATQAVLPHNDQNWKNQRLSHVHLVGFKSFQDRNITYNEEFLSMARTLLLDYKDFLEDQFSDLLNLALLKRELTLSTAYNQAMLVTLAPEEVGATIPSCPLYLTGLKREEPPFVAFYDGIADTAVISLPGDEEYPKSSQNNLKKTEPFDAFYNGVVATALPSSPRNKVGLVKKRNTCVAFYEGSVATTSAVMPRCAQRLKYQPLTHLQLVGSGNIEDEFLSMARTLVLDYKEFMEDKLSSLLNLALLKRELSLSTEYNQAMLATLDPDDLPALATLPFNQFCLARLKMNRLPFVAFYDGIETSAVIFLPGQEKFPEPPAPPTPLNCTRTETGPSRDNININNESGSSKGRVLLPYPQEVPTRVNPSKPRSPVRPQWSRTEKCRLLRDRLDGLPLKYTPRTTKYITFKEDEMDTRRRILNTIPSLKTVSPGSSLARSPLTSWYWLDDTYPDMVSASLKDLASQHMKYFRASPSRAPAQQTGRSQIQVMEDLYWEDLRKMGSSRIADDIHCRRQQGRCFFNKVQSGSVIEGTKLISEGHDKSSNKPRNNAKTVQLNYTACLNTNNNGYTREEGDSDVDPAFSSVCGSKSDQRFSRGPDASRNKPRHSYLNKRHSDDHRSRNRKPAGTEGACADCDKTSLEPEQEKRNTAEDTSHLTDPTLHHRYGRDPKLPQGKDKRTLSPIQSDHELSQESSATHKYSMPQHVTSQLNSVLQNDVQGEEITFKELFQDISNFNALCDIPDSMKNKVVQLICTPFLRRRYSNGVCVLSDLLKSSLPSPGQTIQNQEQHVDQCGSTEGTAKVHTGRSIDSEEISPVQLERDLGYREPNSRRNEKCTVIKDKPIIDDDFMRDLYFTDNSSDERSQSPHSYLHEDFSHNDDVLDIPSLSVLSPSHNCLGQASRAISCPSTLEEVKLASNEPFPSVYVFKRACGPSFHIPSIFWHISVPTLPSDMIHYQVEQDGLTEIVIGSGSFGEVFAATLTVSPGLSRDVVVKEPFTDKTTLDSIVNEAKITMYLESTGCVPICYGLLKNEEDALGIVMEYVGSGQTLYDIMCESDLPRLIWLNIVCQLASGLNKIHKKDILINDIKSDNILVDMSGTLPVVKYCDMGAASYKSGVRYRGAMEGCVHLAPEACAHAETTPACDVFSLGRVLKKIHGVSHISVLLAVSDTCMAENPADRPTLPTVVQRLQDEYTREVLFPTLTLAVPSHAYLDSSDEESEEASTGFVGVNTPINVDTSSPSSPEVNGAVSSDLQSLRGTLRSIRSGEVSPSNNKDLAMMLSVNESDTSLGFVNLDETKDSSSTSKNHVSCNHDSVPSYGHATNSSNIDTGIEFSSEIKDTLAASSKYAEDGSPSLMQNAGTSKSAKGGFTSLTDNTNVANSAQDGNPSPIDRADANTSKSAQDASPSLDASSTGHTVEISTSFNSPNKSPCFYTPAARTVSFCSLAIAPSCTASHFQTPSASLELFSATGSAKMSSSTETPDSASSELQTSPSHSLESEFARFGPAASVDCCVDAEDDVIPVVVIANESPSASDLDTSHLATYRVLCQEELDVYNKHCEDTSVYEDYLPLILPLIMVPLGLLGFI